MRGLALGLLIATSACHPTTQSEIENICTIVCRCETPLPGEQQQCVQQCESPQVTNFVDAEIALPDAFVQPQPTEPAAPPQVVRPPVTGTISDQCVDCVYEHETSCSSLIANCNALCNMNPEPEPGTP